MRTRFRMLAGLAVVFLIAGACSKPPDDTASQRAERPDREEVDPTLVDPDATATAEEAESEDGSGTDGARTRNRVTGTSEPVQNPAADVEHALSVGERVRPQSTDFPGGNRNTWTGVSAGEITFAPGYDVESCGADLVAVITAAGGVLPTQDRFYRRNPRNQDEVRQETEQTIEALMTYFNEHTWEDARAQYPHLKPLMEKFGNADRPFYGRKLVAETFDSGSFQCPEKTTAAATKVGDEIKAFSAFVDRWDGTPTNLADALNAKIPANRRPMMFGTLWLPDSYYSAWEPFVWTQWASGTTIVRQKASWVCSRLVGKPAVNSQRGETTGGTPFSETTRKFGLIYPNRDEDRHRADEFKAALREFCGRDIVAVERDYTFDLSRAADEGQQIMLQMRQANVTSILMLTDPVLPLFQINQARSIDYWPEYLFSSIGYADSNTVQRLYNQDQVNKAAFGLSNLGVYGGFNYDAGDPFWAYHHSHRVAPSGTPCDPSSDEGMDHDPQYCKAPQAIATYYYTMLPLIGGILFAGPDLTPHNVTKGLQAYPPTRFGPNGPTSDPRPPLVGAGQGKHAFLTDAVEWRNRANFKSPYPENTDRWIEYTDCMRHYLLYPDKPSPGWEPGGPHHDAWCGDAKYAPDNSPEKDGYPRITEGRAP